MKIIYKAFILISIFTIINTTTLHADPPGMPDGGHGQNDDQPPGGGAPIGGGAGIFIFLSLAYAFNKKNEPKHPL